MVVCGHPTLSRPVSRLLARDDVQVIDTPTRGVWTERPFPVDERLAVIPHADEPDDPAWLEEWHAADAERLPQLDALLAAEPDLTPYEVAGAVARALPAGRAAGRRRVQPDPRPRPDGAALRGRRRAAR